MILNKDVFCAGGRPGASVRSESSKTVSTVFLSQPDARVLETAGKLLEKAYPCGQAPEGKAVFFMVQETAVGKRSECRALMLRSKKTHFFYRIGGI